MQVFLEVAAQGFALERQVLLAQQVLDYAEGQAVDVRLLEVQSFQQQAEVSYLWRQILPIPPLLPLQAPLKHLNTTVRVSQLKLILAFQHIPRLYI